MTRDNLNDSDNDDEDKDYRHQDDRSKFMGDQKYKDKNTILEYMMNYLLKMIKIKNIQRILKIN